MAQVSLRVPAEAVGPLRDSLHMLYQATAESLHLALRACSERRLPVEELQAHRDRLAQLGALLDGVGWARATRGGDLTLSGPPDVLHDAVYGAVIEAGERLVALDRLLERVDAAGGRP